MNTAKQDFIAFMRDENMFDIDWASSFVRGDYSMQKKMQAVMARVADCVAYDAPDWQFVGKTDHLFGAHYAFNIPRVGRVGVDDIPLMRSVPMAIVQLSDTARVLVSNDIVMNKDMEPAPTCEICEYARLLAAMGNQYLMRGVGQPKLEIKKPYVGAIASRTRALKEFLKNHTK